MKLNKGKISIIFVVCFLMFYSCIKRYISDVYQQIPLGSKLTKEILLHSDQIFQTKTDLILLYNTSKKSENYDPHILIFNNENILLGACYYSSERIDSIKKNIIYGIINNERNKRKDLFRNDLPKGYVLNLVPYKGTSGRFGNKIIEEINVNDSCTVAQFKVLVSYNRFILAGKNLNDINLELLKEFNLRDTVTYKISDLLINSKDGVIHIRGANAKKEMSSEFLIVKNIHILDEFYNKLWNKLNQK